MVGLFVQDVIVEDIPAKPVPGETSFVNMHATPQATSVGNVEGVTIPGLKI